VHGDVLGTLCADCAVDFILVYELVDHVADLGWQAEERRLLVVMGAGCDGSVRRPSDGSYEIYRMRHVLSM
jgi:hypothetical protein